MHVCILPNSSWSILSLKIVSALGKASENFRKMQEKESFISYYNIVKMLSKNIFESR